MQLSQEEVSSRFEAAQVAYKGKIRTFAWGSYKQLPGFSPEDLEQELLIVLWRCAMNYDPDKGATFNTLFTCSARNRITSLLRQSLAQRRYAVVNSLDAEGMQQAVDQVLSSPSAEDLALLKMRIKEVLKGGTDQSGEQPVGGRQRHSSKHRARQIA